jgi:hypothetical protein
MGIGDWGLGIGDWGLGIGPNPQSPIPNPQSPIPFFHLNNTKKFLINIIKFNLYFFKILLALKCLSIESHLK